jgi:hypothetical protein
MKETMQFNSHGLFGFDVNGMSEANPLPGWRDGGCDGW